MASRVNPVVEAYMRWGSMVSSEPSPSPTKKVMAVSAMATAIGRSIRISTNSSVKISNVSMARALQVTGNENGMRCPGMVAGIAVVVRAASCRHRN